MMIKKSKIFLLTLNLTLLWESRESARILAIMPTPSYSHQIVFNPLWLALHSRGHHVTLFTTDPIRDLNVTNFRQVDWSFAYKLWHEKHNVSEIIKNFNSNLLKCLSQYVEMMNDIIIQELEHPQVRQIISDESEHFDLVIVEFLNPAMIAFGNRFKCPFIGMSSMDVTSFVHEALGNPISPALFPDFIAPFDCDMTFFERVLNSFYYLGTKLYFRYHLFRESDKILRKYFGDNTPRLEDMQKNVSMVFLNINPIIHDVRPLMEHVVVTGGGTHFEKNASLPEDIQEFLDDAELGVIYFSLGTNVKSAALPETTKSAFVQAFSELPYKVLWKFEDSSTYANPKIMIKRWVPQQQVLKHPNIKLFITQGGLQSLEEAIHNAIPIIGLPVYVDQFSNVRRVTRKGLGIMLDYKNVEKETLKEAINEIITNKEFKDTARELSTILREKPVSGLTQAVWWVEYIVKHRGAKFLKRPEIPFYQYLLLDVLAFIFFTTCVFAFLFHKISCFLLFLIKERRRDKLMKVE